MTTPAAPMPVNYDSAVLNIDLSAFPDYILDMTGLIDQISESVVVIMDAISNLTLGWAGDTAAEVTAFFDSWNAAVNVLFGNGDPNASLAESGTLNILASALTTAMLNYDQTETVLAQQFISFTQALTSASGDQSPANVTDTLKSAVGETFSG